MPALIIKREDGRQYEVQVKNFNMTVEELREVLASPQRGAPSDTIPAQDQRIVCDGKVLTNTLKRSLESFNISNNSTLTLLADISGPEVAFGAMPGSMGQMQSHLLQNPDVMQQMMNSPAMQQLLNSPALLKSVLNLNPAWRALIDRNPELGNMFYDENFQQQSLEAFRNPSMMRDVMRTTDRAMQNIETLPGGFDTLRRMHAQVAPSMKSRADACLADKERAMAMNDVQNIKPPEWTNDFDPNAMAAMVQDPNMQQLMASLSQPKNAADKAKAAPTPFANPGFLQQMFAPQNMQAMAAMQQAMANMEVAGQESGIYVPVDDTSPALSFSDSFGNFLQAQAENPEIRWRTQLMALKNMGFTDTEKCIAHLQLCNGVVNDAVNSMLREEAH